MPVPGALPALTPSGAVKVADLVYTQLGIGNLPPFSPGGTGYVATTESGGDNGVVTTVTSFSPLTNL